MESLNIGDNQKMQDNPHNNALEAITQEAANQKQKQNGRRRGLLLTQHHIDEKSMKIQVSEHISEISDCD